MATRTEKMLATLVRFEVSRAAYVPDEIADAASRLAREILGEETDTPEVTIDRSLAVMDTLFSPPGELEAPVVQAADLRGGPEEEAGDAGLDGQGGDTEGA